MTPARILECAKADGVTLTLSPAGTIKATGEQVAVNRWLPMIREHKPGLLATMQRGELDPGNTAGASDLAPVDPAREDRRQRVLAMLDKRPRSRYAVVVDNPDTEPAILALAIRDKGTCELRIPREKYDNALLLALIERHGGSAQNAPMSKNRQ